LNDSKPPVSAIAEVKIDKWHEDLHIPHAASVQTYPTRPLSWRARSLMISNP